MRIVVSFFLLSLLFVVSACMQSEPASVELRASSSTRKQNSTEINPFKVTLKSGDTLYTIARHYNVETRDIIDLNRLSPPYELKEGDTLKLPKPRFHEVMKGDTVFSIAKVYNISISSLVRVNRLEAPYVIKTGQRLRMPSSTDDNDSATMIAEDRTAGNRMGESAEFSSNSSAVESRVLAPIGKFSTSTPSAGGAAVASSSNAPISLEGSPWEKTLEVPATVGKTAGAAIEKSGETVASAPFTGDSPFPSAAPSQHPSIAVIAPKIAAPKTATAAVAPGSSKGKTSSSEARFAWPVKGKVISRFGPKLGGTFNDGIIIAAPEGTKICAPAAGTVAYAGNELKGYGNLILLRHPNGYVTSYAHLQDRHLKVGDSVAKGDVIAHVGKTGNAPSPQLHFSIRKGKKALNPEELLL